MKTVLDFETRSRVNLKKVGAWAYAAHPSTDVTCLRWVRDDLPGIGGWYREPPIIAGHKRRVDIYELAFSFKRGRSRAVAHSAQFEYAIWHFIMHRRYGYPALLDPKWWDCTSARAFAAGLPGSLEGACLALNLPDKKDIEGAAVMMQICKPRQDGTFNEDPALYRRNYEYCGQDVVAERGLDRALPELSDFERRVWELDLVMNRRGLPIDVRSCEKGAALADKITTKLNARLRKITKGELSAATQIAMLKEWVKAQGVELPTKTVDVKEEDGTVTQEEKETLDKVAIGELLNRPEVPAGVKEAISIRAQVAKSSTAKFRSMLIALGPDWRVRGAFQYYGGHTGRDAGRLIQPQNYPQGFVDNAQRDAIELLDDPELFCGVYAGEEMDTLSGVLRGMICAPEDRLLVGADYNAIECRGLNWCADELWVLDLFRRGETPYLAMAEKIFGQKGLSKKDNPKEYDIGKRAELGCGFGMGAFKFQSSVYNETAKKGPGLLIPDELAKRAVKAYRESHPRVVGMWYATERAAINAVNEPGKTFSVAGGRIMYKMSECRRWLLCRLPSGRLMRYFRPSIRVEPKFGEEKQVLYYWAAAGEGAIKTDCNKTLGWYKTWGGELVENYVQALCRDIMMNGALHAEAAGFPLVLRAHDELLAEIAYRSGEWELRDSKGELAAAMCRLPDWAKTCPITASEDGRWIGRRYRK